MKRTQTIEIIGIGNFNIYPVTINEQEYNKVSQNGLILNKKILEPSKPAKYIYIDDKNTEYSNDRVFTDFNGVILQQIKRTEKVKNFDIVDKMEIYNLTEYNLSILDSDLTTKNIFDEKIKDKAIMFKLKKSTIGFNFWKAFILKLNGVLVMVTGKGDLNKALNEFSKLEQSKKEHTEITIQKVEIKAEELDDLIQL